MLKPAAEQQSALDQFLKDQQDPASPEYHRWLTPEQYADRFGTSQADVDKITAWLKSQNLTVAEVGRGRSWIAFSGAAADVQNAFTTEIHNFEMDGNVRFANTTEPSVPAALRNVVHSVHGLNNFRLKPRARAKVLAPNYTSTKGNHYLAPGDVSVIYNIKPLYNAGITGAGQKIVVVGQSQFKMTDATSFRSTFGLPVNNPQVTLVPNTKDPGVVDGDVDEANLDVQWTGAVAPNATILFVYSYDVMDAVQYAIDQNLAPVLSMSYGLCELLNSNSDISTQQSMARQANAQGITWFAASGDAGGADCGGGSSKLSGLSVDLPAGLPEVTGIGGTTFSDATGTYWNTTNDTTSRASALSYIPEVSWNDSVADGEPSASGGGASALFTNPAWQTGAGVPSNGARNVPDVALSASVDHIGYLVYSGGSQVLIGGTSAGAPSFAGIAALLNQYLISTGAQQTAGLGNINPRLYSMAQTTPSAFHDITAGDNIVNACGTKRGCTAGSVGFAAGPGYDQVTGLGTVDAYELVTKWRATGAAVKRSSSLVLTSNVSTVSAGGSAVLTATVSSTDSGSPSGTVTFNTGSTALGTATLVTSGQKATATLTVSVDQLAQGTALITAQYSGDTSYDIATASLVLTTPSATSGPTAIRGIANGASFRDTFAPGMILSVFGSNLATVVQSASSVPLPTQLSGVSATINGLNAPLYYVSAGQLNVQIPYELNVSAPATLTVSNNGQTTTYPLALSTAAPGVFVDGNGAPVPSTTAKVGSVATLFITGAGALTPSLATGNAPAATTAIANLPKPAQVTTVTVDGVPAAIQFIGNPGGLVGVVQINYQVPAGVATGSRAVIVTVGGNASAAAALTVTP